MNALQEIAAANRAGAARGIPSYCTAHPETLRAIFSAYRGSAEPILVEATCNQVNQFGGYTGMTPAAFRVFVEGLAREQGVDPARLILGGDHLGPNPWTSEPAESAMAKAKAMVAAYVAAGFTKIHLDASMACADDIALDEATMAARAAELCAVAEAGGSGLVYVIGTEVPVPGGETEALDTLAVTSLQAVRRTFELHRQAFAARGLEPALARVIAMVVQPGVDFGNDQVFPFRPERAAALSGCVLDLPGVAFEAHSTDYQSEEALGALVQNHFAILKVGPELTFAFRQAVIAMAHIETDWQEEARSDIVNVIRTEMREHPKDWRAYIAPGDREEAMMLYGLSDRVRYYWPRPRVQAALGRLYANLASARPEPGLIAQFTGCMVEEPADPALLPRRIVDHMVGAVVAKYRRAADRKNFQAA